MKALKSKRGFAKFNINIIELAAIAIIGLAVLFQIVAATIPVLNDALGNLVVLGVPMSGIFIRNGVIILLVMAALILVTIGIFLSKKQGR